MAFAASAFHIFLWVCLPIFVLTSAGWVLDRRFSLDLGSLVKLNIYLMVPCFIFVRVYSSEAPGNTAFNAFLFTITMVAVLLFLAYALTFRAGSELRKALMLSMFYNCGNFGIPLAALAFGPAATDVQVFALLAMNIATFSVGMVIAASQGKSGGSSAAETTLLLLRQPSIYAITLAFVCRAIPYDLTQVTWIWKPANYAAEALIGFALITLGVQLSKTKPAPFKGPVSLAILLKLAIAPLIAWPMTKLFGFDELTSTVLIASTAAPTAINTALLAHEFKGDSQFAATAVFYSTLASVVTVSIVLALLGVS